MTQADGKSKDARAQRGKRADAMGHGAMRADANGQAQQGKGSRAKSTGQGQGSKGKGAKETTVKGQGAKGQGSRAKGQGAKGQGKGEGKVAQTAVSILSTVTNVISQVQRHPVSIWGNHNAWYSGAHLARASQVTASGIHCEGEDAEGHIDDHGMDV